MVEIEKIIQSEQSSSNDINFEQRSQSLLRNTSILSEAGKILLEKVEAAMKSDDSKGKAEIAESLPTVEDPRLELFQEILTDATEREKTEILLKLSTVQVTKGCSHHCLHCAAGAENRITRMPYVVAAKIAAESKEVQSKTLNELNNTGAKVLGQLRLGEIEKQTVKGYFQKYEGIESSNDDYPLEAAKILSERKFFFKQSCSESYRELVNIFFHNAAGRIPKLIEMPLESLDSAGIRQLQKEIILAFRNEIAEQLSQDDFLEGLGNGEEREENLKTIQKAIIMYMDNQSITNGRRRSYFGDIIINNTVYNIWSDMVEDAIIRAVTMSKAPLEDLDRDQALEQSLDLLSLDEEHPFRTYRDRLLPGRYNLDNIFSVISEVDAIGDGVIKHYSDSDPFDYRDLSIRHKDGTPADYSDIYKLFNVDNKNICVITAGWKAEDKIAQRAAEELKLLGAEIELSVHYFGNLARRDEIAYKESIKNVIKTMHPNIGYRIFGQKAENLVREIHAELGIEDKIYSMQSLSIHSGRAKENSENPAFDSFIKRDWDVMDSTPGYEVLPSGKISHRIRGKEALDTGLTIF